MLWELPTVVRNGPLVPPNAGSAPRTSCSNWSSTAAEKWPFYMIVPQAENQPTKLASTALVVTHPTPMMCFAHPSLTERSAARSHGIKGEAF